MSLDDVLARIDDDLPAATDRLLELLRIPSISTDPAYKEDCDRAADWLVADLQSMGVEAEKRVTPGHPMVVGHVGDGNLHYNVFPTKGRNRSEYEVERGEVKRIVHDLVQARDGSFSAEHGVGRMKVDDLMRYGDPTRIAMMRSIKNALDPHGIMNPGVIVPLLG